MKKIFFSNLCDSYKRNLVTNGSVESSLYRIGDSLPERLIRVLGSEKNTDNSIGNDDVLKSTIGRKRKFFKKKKFEAPSSFVDDFLGVSPLNHYFNNWESIGRWSKQQLGGTNEIKSVNFQNQVNQEHSRRITTTSDKLRFDFTPTQPPTLYDVLDIIPTRYIKPVNEIPSYIRPSSTSTNPLSWYEDFSTLQPQERSTKETTKISLIDWNEPFVYDDKNKFDNYVNYFFPRFYEKLKSAHPNATKDELKRNASFLVAHSAYENGYGTSNAFRFYHNLGGDLISGKPGVFVYYNSFESYIENKVKSMDKRFPGWTTAQTYAEYFDKIFQRELSKSHSDSLYDYDSRKGYTAYKKENKDMISMRKAVRKYSGVDMGGFDFF